MCLILLDIFQCVLRMCQIRNFFHISSDKRKSLNDSDNLSGGFTGNSVDLNFKNSLTFFY